MAVSHSSHSELWDEFQRTIQQAIVSETTLRIRGEDYLIQGLAHSGPYGKLHFIQCERTGKQYLWKISSNPQKGLKTEALLQKFAWKELTTAGFPWAIPPVHEIFDHPVHGIGFLMDHYQTAHIFFDFLQKKVRWMHPCEENDRLFQDCFIQLAVYLLILEQKLQMNHRDVKSTNIILIHPDEKPKTVEFKHESTLFRFRSPFRVVLIDFGFACTQLPTSKILAAGNYLPKFDGCPKRGRDFFVLLGHLWNLPEVRASVTPRFASWFKTRLQTEKKQWYSVVEKLMEHALSHICLFTTASQFDVPECSPLRVLESLAHDFPLVLQRHTTNT